MENQTKRSSPGNKDPFYSLIDGILKSLVDGIIVTDTDHRIILMNPAAENLLGIRLNQVINRSIDVAISEPILLEKIKSFLKNSQGGDSSDFERTVGDERNVQIIRASASGIENQTGCMTGIVTLLHDVTHERELDRLKDEFISTAAHELRTPLTSIQGFSEILITRKNVDDTERRKFLSYINEKAVTLNRLLDDLLDLSRIESGAGFAFLKRRIDFSALISRVVDLFRSQAIVHDFRLRLPPHPLFLEIDPNKMEQVMENLLSNAVKYTPEGGPIRIRADLEHEQCTVVIEDQGMGMTPCQVDHIFDKFYRGDATNTAIGGTGLGMSIVRSIIDGHNGTISVESEKGIGTKVVFSLPVSEPPTGIDQGPVAQIHSRPQLLKKNVASSSIRP